MNIDMSPRVRHIVSGLAAVATTALLMSTLVEAFTPLLGSGTAQASAPVATAAVDLRRNAALVRRI